MTLKALAYLLVTSASALAELLQLGGASVVRAGRPGSTERRSGLGRPGSGGTSRRRGVAGRTGSGEPRSGPRRPESDDANCSRGPGGRNRTAQVALAAGRGPVRRGGAESGAAGRGGVRRGGVRRAVLRSCIRRFRSRAQRYGREIRSGEAAQGRCSGLFGRERVRER